MGRALTASIFIICFLPVSSIAATYHIAKTGNNANSCSQAQSLSTPKLTIQAGVNCATNPGDIVAVHTGTYTESVSFPKSGGSGNPIRIQPAGYTNDGCKTAACGAGDTVIWIGGAASPAATISDHSHIRIQGFTFRNTMTSSNAGFPNAVIYAANSSCYAEANDTCKNTPIDGIEILNNTFSNNGNDGLSSGNQSNVLVLHYLGWNRSYSGLNTSEVAGNTFTSNYGFSINIGGTSDLHVANNMLTSGHGSINTSLIPPEFWYHGGFVNAYGACGSAACWPPDNLVIEGNKIENVTSVSYPQEMDGIRLDACKGSHGIIIQDNVIHDIHDATNNFGSFNNNQSYGIFLEAGCDFQVIQRNVIYNVRLAGMAFGRGDGASSNNGSILHNTVYVNAISALHLYAGTGLTIKNNILVNTANGPEVVGTETHATSGNTWRNNLYWNPTGTVIGNWSTNDISKGASLTLSQWNSSSGEAGSKNANPMFVNAPTDFNLQAASPAKNAGDDGKDVGCYPMSPPNASLPAPENLKIVNP